MSERYWRHTGCDRTIISLFIKLVLPIPISPLMSVFLHILHFSVPIMEWSIEKVEINLSPELYYSLAFVGFCAPNTSTAVISIDFLALFSFWNLYTWNRLVPMNSLHHLSLVRCEVLFDANSHEIRFAFKIRQRAQFFLLLAFFAKRNFYRPLFSSTAILMRSIVVIWTQIAFVI